jgi:NADH:ubiquinone oxidoreductase subunit 5 (subunit L)/multisubunit Na+/H+ antiporter MnhA subunit
MTTSNPLGFKILFFIFIFLTPVYLFRAYYLTFCGSPKSEQPKYHENRWVMTLPLIILSIFSLILGIIQTPWSPYLANLLPAVKPVMAHFDLKLASFSVELAILGIIAGLFYAKSQGESWFKSKLPVLYQVLINKYGMDAFWEALVRYGLLNFSRLASWFDETIIDGSVNLCGKIIYNLGNTLRYQETGSLQYYALIMLLALVLLLVTVALTSLKLFDFNSLSPLLKLGG